MLGLNSMLDQAYHDAQGIFVHSALQVVADLLGLVQTVPDSLLLILSIASRKLVH